MAPALGRAFIISIHVLREEDDSALRDAVDAINISIHVLREEDDVRHGYGIASQGISIHVLREEDDRSSCKNG